MKTIIYSTKFFERTYFEQANVIGHELKMVEEALSLETACLAKDCSVVCVFTSDDVSAPVLLQLQELGVRYIAVRATGYDNVDIQTALSLGMKVANVPEYSPHGIAEHAVGLMLALSRKLMLANQQVHHYNFKVDDLIGFNLQHKTVGIVGTGKIGSAMAKILHGFGCHLLGYDIHENKELVEKYGLHYMELEMLCRLSDVITIHVSLNEHTEQLIDKEMIEIMKKGVMVINTARGAVVNTMNVIEGIENGHIGYFGTDVYEKEKGVFFNDYSNKTFEDTMLKKLLSFPNVLLTPHQAFATKESLYTISTTTFHNIGCWALEQNSANELHFEPNIRSR
ncbi:2-hydroxyacid dehydrogenase [Solitalea koreensis]|uniref:D-lactate dehydrogenase n=1 Tax=Solitalea koreensis TaxID=543615 RepID=A0A521DE42_9SPHI|nr:2-hydroxyacid dehydrogenase [Solitalea koreensis]SMO69858.1 D-lactate dehydrogenase [Solitalea koreensis]